MTKQYPTNQYLNEVISNREFAEGVPPEIVIVMARQLLASMEQEPVAWTTGGFSQNVGCNFGEKEPGEAPSIATVYWDRNVFRHYADCEETSDRWLAEAIKNTGAMPLYAAPQLPQPVVPETIVPGGLVYSSALPKFESNDSDKVVGYHCFISGDTRTVESQEQAYADAKIVVNAFRAAMLHGDK